MRVIPSFRPIGRALAQTEAARNHALRRRLTMRAPCDERIPGPGTGIRVSGCPPREAEPDARPAAGPAGRGEGRPGRHDDAEATRRRAVPARRRCGAWRPVIGTRGPLPEGSRHSEAKGWPPRRRPHRLDEDIGPVPASRGAGGLTCPEGRWAGPSRQRCRYRPPLGLPPRHHYGKRCGSVDEAVMRRKSRVAPAAVGPIMHRDGSCQEAS